jgi:hypothetical protein
LRSEIWICGQTDSLLYWFVQVESQSICDRLGYERWFPADILSKFPYRRPVWSIRPLIQTIRESLHQRGEM